MSLGHNDGRLPGAMPGGVDYDLRAWLGAEGELPAELRWATAADTPTASPRPHGRGFRAGRLQVGLTASRKDLDRLQAEAAARRAMFDRIRIPTVTPAVITLGSGFGGQGKTMIAAALCIILAMLRAGERVIGLDVNADMGNLFERLGGNLDELPEELWPVTLRDFYLACAENKINNYTNARDLVAWLQNCAAVRGDTPDARIDHEFGATQYFELLEYVMSLFSIIVNDGGTKLLDDLHTGALRTTHQYIFVAEPTALGARSVLDALRFYELYDGANFTQIMSRAIVVLNMFDVTDEKHQHWYDQLMLHLRDTGITLLVVPWDAALKDRSNTLNLSLVQRDTLMALLRLAAAVLEGINTFAREVGNPVAASRTPKSAIPVLRPGPLAGYPAAEAAAAAVPVTVAQPGAGTTQDVGTGWPKEPAAAPGPPAPLRAATAAQAVQDGPGGSPGPAAPPPVAAAASDEPSGGEVIGQLEPEPGPAGDAAVPGQPAPDPWAATDEIPVS